MPVYIKRVIIITIITLGSIFICSQCHSFINNYFRVNVPSGSMLKTIAINDQLLIKKDISSLQRGDIIVFYHENELMIKRLIGMPGEVVDIRNGVVYIDGEQLDEGYVGSKDFFTGTYVVPKDSFFMLGDNRANSCDSRYWDDSYVSINDVVGYAVYFIYPHIRKVVPVEYEVL